MKYCISYYKNFRYLDEIDEIIFSPVDINENFIEFIENNIKQEQRVIISLVHEPAVAEVLPMIDKLKEVHENYAIIIKYSEYQTSLDIDFNKYKYFFSDYCKTFDQVYSFIRSGATDVYVVETLGFSLKDIGEYARERGVAVRVMPNVAQSSLGSHSELPYECRFFIRPEDTDLYESYVDVFELFGDSSKFSVTYEIYKEKKWDGPINYVIKGLYGDLFTLQGAIPFGEHRLNCGQKCYKCKLCTRTKEVNKILDENGLIVAENKDGESIEEETV